MKKLAEIIKDEILKKATEEKTIIEYELENKDVSDLQKACQYVYYGFYDEKAKKMKPSELLKYLQQKVETQKSQSKFYKSWTETRFPQAIELVQNWIKNNI